MPDRIIIMVLFFLLGLFAWIAISFPAESAMDEKIKVSDIYYFGYEGLDLPQLKAALPLKSGDEFADYPQFGQRCAEIKARVKKLTGKESTDEALVFTDKKYIVFIGLPGKSNIAPALRPDPKGKAKVPDAIHKLYDQAMEANVAQLRSGAEKDKQAYLEIRKRTKSEALKVPALLLEILNTSSSAKERYVAAHALGLITETREQLAALVEASIDSDSTVRNNATRAISVILMDEPAKAPLIPFSHFVEMLNSPTWTDKNKGTITVCGLSAATNPKLLKALKENCLPAPKEMCSWPSGYSESALQLLGRVAGLKETKISELIRDGKGAEIFKALDSKVAASK